MGATAQIYDVNTFQPAKAVGQLMCRVRAAYIAALDQALAQEPEIAGLEISAAQYTILNVLEQRGVDSAAQLCKDISYDGGAMTRMVDRLEAKGLVSRRRSEDDRRLINLELTEEGRLAVPKLRACSAQVLNHLLRGFSATEVRQFEGFLARMLQNS
ncbi:MAG: MarR family winged helix-turn-helix transcriptional regulator [Steroidobacteraceae bacterium]|jgi:MarR family transcriptional regulator, multiple antibiotic resistance protein MarR